MRLQGAASGLIIFLLLPLSARAESERTLLNVHILKDGSIGGVEVLNSNGDPDFAVCYARRLWPYKRFHRGQTEYIDHWEKLSVLRVTGSARTTECG